MLCFVFSALVALLDQLFKRWITITLAAGERVAERAVIPGIIKLTYVPNDGAAFSILSGQRWLLAALMFVCIVILVAILLRYNEGFWGTLGLAAVLGGSLGNFIDRVYLGYVVDMFELEFMNFAIFNIADIFITLGGITFCVFFVIASIRASRDEEDYYEQSLPEAIDITGNIGDDDYVQDARIFDLRPEENSAPAVEPVEPRQLFETPLEPLSFLDEIESFKSNMSGVDLNAEYDIDKLLREYGFEEDQD